MLHLGCVVINSFIKQRANYNDVYRRLTFLFFLQLLCDLLFLGQFRKQIGHVL